MISRAGLNSDALTPHTTSYQTADLMKRSDPHWSSGGKVMVAGLTGRAGTYELAWQGAASSKPTVSGGTLQPDGKTLVANAGVLTLNWGAKAPDKASLMMSGHAPGEVFSHEYLKFIEPAGGIRLMDWLQTNNSANAKWSDRCQVDAMQWSTPKGGPLEPWFDWAAKNGKMLWVNVPHLADDDYIRNLAALAKQKLQGSSATLYVERSNEVWNAQFQQNSHANTQGIALKTAWKLADDGNTGFLWARYHAARTHDIATIFKQEYPDAKIVLGCGLAKNTDADNSLAWLARVRGPGAAAMFTGGLAIAPYFGSSLPADGSWKTWSPQQFAQHALDSTARLDDPTQSGTARGIAAYQQTAKKHGLTVSAYEHGFDLNQGKDNLANKVAAQRLPDVGKAVHDNTAWLLSKGGLRLAFYYKERSLWNESGVWGLENTAEKYDGPKYQGWVTAANEFKLTDGGGGGTNPQDPGDSGMKLMPPTGLQLTVDGARLKLTWKKVVGARYNLYLNKKLIGSSSDEMEFTKDKASGDYYVTSVKNGKESQPSNTVKFP